MKWFKLSVKVYLGSYMDCIKRNRLWYQGGRIQLRFDPSICSSIRQDHDTIPYVHIFRILDFILPRYQFQHLSLSRNVVLLVFFWQEKVVHKRFLGIIVGKNLFRRILTLYYGICILTNLPYQRKLKRLTKLHLTNIPSPMIYGAKVTFWSENSIYSPPKIDTS